MPCRGKKSQHLCVRMFPTVTACANRVCATAEMQGAHGRYTACCKRRFRPTAGATHLWYEPLGFGSEYDCLPFLVSSYLGGSLWQTVQSLSIT